MNHCFVTNQVQGPYIVYCYFHRNKIIPWLQYDFIYSAQWQCRSFIYAFSMQSVGTSVQEDQLAHSPYQSHAHT
ncbi:hypothetical protein FGO68_gene8266 [Halteria grandinella]|uniref:Uncharacterized protein n=1 Tax=Halteria grandinella TaxID=5974 RepID=A0A8J8NZF9_HALGN|nr:hypothetical protein FGO68_gene8266 [Halteria grandinella]